MKLLKFDTINPESYLIKKTNENFSKVKEFSRTELLDWIISLRSNFSDFYTYNLKNEGWEAEEFIVSDFYIEKVADEIYRGKTGLKRTYESVKDILRPLKSRWNKRIIVDYIKQYKPDVIFVREVIGIPSEFWRYFMDRSLLVCRIAAKIPRNWSPLDWDMILTSTETFRNFFILNKVDSYINHNGFDERILNELKPAEKIYDVTFTGGLGKIFWESRTKCAEYVASKSDFKWWGVKGKDITSDSSLSKSYQGVTSGLEMLQIYKNSKIVFNDYGEIAEGRAVNQRIFEVLGTGSLLITREADNLMRDFPKDIFVMYKNEKDCIEKVNYYLKNEKEREEIAQSGQKFIIENYNYKTLMKEFSELLKKKFEKKFFNNKKQW